MKMNEITTLTQTVNNVGFPIAVSMALFYQFIKTNDIIREFQEAIVKHTTTIDRLIDVIEKRGEDV